MMEADSSSETLDFPIDIPPDDDPSVALLEEDRRNNQIHATSGDASTPPLLTEPTPSERRLRELAQQGPLSHDDEINVGDFIGMGNFADHPDHMMDTADVTISLDPNILPGPYTLNCVLKSSSICYILYLGTLSSILVGGLIANGTATCEKPLIAWAAVESALFLMMMAKSVGIFFDVPARIAAMDRNSNIRRYMMGFMYIGHRVLNFVWFVWFIFGAVWTMDAKSKCSDEAFAIWVTTLVVVVIQMSMFALVGLIVCGACCCFCFCYFFASSRFEGNKGASKKLIEKTTKTETYSTESTQIAKEDAICAICLSDYNEGDNLRYLPCGHHFHSECVDQWLLTNKSCASCRRLIDSPPPTAGEKEKEKEAEDATNIVVSAVGPDNV